MILDRFPQLKGLILDMDGVLWHDNEPIGDLAKIFADITELGLKVVLATNNATKLPEDYALKLSKFHIDFPREHILSSSETTAIYLANTLQPGSRVYVVGSSSLSAVLKKSGFELANVEEFKHADAVVVGLDTHITHEKIANAALLIRAGARFVATNTDATYPTPQGLYPGAGVMVAAVQTASGQVPEVIGKPFTAMYKEALLRLGTINSETMGVGDRLETDIAGAQNAGCLAGAVLTGVCTELEAQTWAPTPDLIARDLDTLING